MIKGLFFFVRIACLVSLGVGCSAPEPLESPAQPTGTSDISLTTSQDEWTLNPANGHRYRLTNNLSWQSAEAQAEEWGGHLVTVNDAEENAWLVSTFGDVESFWIGYSDKDTEGDWHWINGDVSPYTNWFRHACGIQEPTDSPPGEDYAILNYFNLGCTCKENGVMDGYESAPGAWNDLLGELSFYGIVEVE